MEMEIAFPGGARVDASFGRFVVKTDQPLYGGGDNSAPTPFALFLASIGTCAGIYVLNFCQQRNIPTANIRVRQRTVSDPASRMICRINLDIVLPPEFPEKYSQALIRSVELCAVKKHMENPPEFKIETHIGQG